MDIIANLSKIGKPYCSRSRDLSRAGSGLISRGLSCVAALQSFFGAGAAGPGDVALLRSFRAGAGAGLPYFLLLFAGLPAGAVALLAAGTAGAAAAAGFLPNIAFKLSKSSILVPYFLMM